MSEVLVKLGSAGADTIIKATREALDKALQAHGAAAKVTFDQTNYCLPLINAL
jgi:hypothetical protein